MKIALIQLRAENDPMAIHEIECFLKHCHLQPEQLLPINAIIEKPTNDILKDCDILMFGGSGDYSVVNEHKPWYDPIADLIREGVEADFPIFGSCMGIQLIAAALGGKVILDNDHREVGTYQITVNDNGRQDPLFSTLPEKFWGQVGHKCRISILPEGAVNLASSKLCPYHAFKLEGKPVYATQFHPELDYKDNVKRLKHYYQKYHQTGNGESLEEMLQQFKEGDTEITLLRDFIELVSGN